MKKILLLFLSALFLLSSCGCAMEEKVYALSDVSPGKKWEKVWVIEDRNTDLELRPAWAVFKGYCQVHYLGDGPAEDVRIAVGSPLTSELIGAQMTREFGTVRPGDKLVYEGSAECPDWADEIPLYVFEDKLTEDYKNNFYVEISWCDGERQYSEQFFKWHPEAGTLDE